MYVKQITILLISGLCLFISTVQGDDLAVKRFQSGLNACDRALAMEMPKSRGALQVLQSLQKRYQRNKEQALESEATLKDSTKHHYVGDFFAEQTTFQEAFQICETKLATKLNEAKQVVAEKIAEREDKQLQQEAVVEHLVDKIEAAKEQVKIAVEKNCLVYLQSTQQVDGEKPALTEEKIAALQTDYKAAKQKSLEIYPDIVKQFYTVTMLDPLTAEKTEESKPILNWFKSCEALFTEEHIATTPIGPKRPSTKPGEMPVVEPELSSTDEPMEDEMYESDYRAVMKKMRGDKLNVLQKEKRLPDYTDDETDNFQAAKTWQYEEEQRCVVYVFKGNTLVKTKELATECPML